MLFCFPAGMVLPVGLSERRAGMRRDELPSARAARRKRA